LHIDRNIRQNSTVKGSFENSGLLIGDPKGVLGEPVLPLILIVDVSVEIECNPGSVALVNAQHGLSSELLKTIVDELNELFESELVSLLLIHLNKTPLNEIANDRKYPLAGVVGLGRVAGRVLG